SLEGDGLIFLGRHRLTVGNSASTTFSGIIQDGGLGGGTHGALNKVGKGKLTLSNNNLYSGGTTVSKGTLLITNKTGYATGTGPVSVKGGTLGGTGKSFDAVTIGTATTAGVLSPGIGAKPGKLTFINTLAFNALGNYTVDLNSTVIKADQVQARGV